MNYGYWLRYAYMEGVVSTLLATASIGGKVWQYRSSIPEGGGGLDGATFHGDPVFIYIHCLVLNYMLLFLTKWCCERTVFFFG
jgi:hypothetical protein